MVKEVRDLLKGPEHGLAASHGALTGMRHTVTENLAPGIAGLRRENQELRTGQNRLEDDLSGLRTAVEELRRELAETRIAPAGAPRHRPGPSGGDPGPGAAAGAGTTIHGERWGTTGEDAVGQGFDKAGDRRDEEEPGTTPGTGNGDAPGAPGADGNDESVTGEREEPDPGPVEETPDTPAEDAATGAAEAHPSRAGFCGDVPPGPEDGAAPVDGSPAEASPGEVGAGEGAIPEAPGSGEEAVPDGGAVPEGDPAPGEAPGVGTPPGPPAGGGAEAEDEAFVATLEEAASIATARLICHRDTWQFLLEHTAPHAHFRVPDRVTDLAGGRTEAFLSGRSLLAVLVTTRDLHRDGTTDPVGRALAGVVHRRAREAVAGVAPGAPGADAGTGDGVTTIVLDDRPSPTGS